MKITDIKDKLNRTQGKMEAHQQQYRSTVSKMAELKEHQSDLEKALVIAQTVAKATQEELEYKLSDIVTASLAAVFPDPYEFKIHFEIKRNKTEARMVFSRDGYEIDPMEASGGGVIEIASLALRIACFLISCPRPAPVFVMDEVGKFISEEYQEEYAKLLTHLADKLGIQFIMITHVPAYEIGNVIKF